MTIIPLVLKRPEDAAPWAVFGSSEPMYRRWAPHVCGIACCRSLILAAHGEAPTLWELTRRGIELGVFRETSAGISGAYHQPLADLLREFGIEAHLFGNLQECDLHPLPDSRPVLLSIDLAKLQAGRGSHLVLITSRTATAYRVLDSACILDKTGYAILGRSELSSISNAKGLLVEKMPGRP